jgi:hypothetical protein
MAGILPMLSNGCRKLRRNAQFIAVNANVLYDLSFSLYIKKQNKIKY